VFISLSSSRSLHASILLHCKGTRRKKREIKDTTQYSFPFFFSSSFCSLSIYKVTREIERGTKRRREKKVKAQFLI